MQTKLVTAAIAVVLAPALLMAQKVSYDYDKTANFAGFKTYAHEGRDQVGQQLIDDRIVAAIDTELAAKGFTKTEANPDVFVVYHVAFDKQKDISTYSSGYGGGYGAYGWGWGGGWAGGTTTTQVRDILVGTLVIDMADAKKGPARLARHGRQGSQHPGQPREARQEHQQRREEDLQELSAEGEDVARRRNSTSEVTSWSDDCWSPRLCCCWPSLAAQAQSPPGPQREDEDAQSQRAYAELLRSDVRTQKVAIITEVMGFTEAEDTAFWPIYREYDAEMAKLGDERVALIARIRQQLFERSPMRSPTSWRPRRSTSRHGGRPPRPSATSGSRPRCRRARPCAFCRSSISCSC